MTKQNVVIAAVIFLAGLAVGKYTLKPEVQIKEVEKQVIVKNENTHVITKKLPDGTVIKERTTIKNDTIATEKSSEVVPVQKQWAAGAGYQFGLVPVYSLKIDRRIIGPIFVGAEVNTNRDVGVTVKMEF